MLKKFSRKSKQAKDGSKKILPSEDSHSSSSQDLPQLTVLVIDSFRRDWVKNVFPKVTEGTDKVQYAVRVVQTRWEDMTVVAEAKSAFKSAKNDVLLPKAPVLTVHVRNHRSSNEPDREPMGFQGQISPVDFVLVRQLVRQLPPDKQDFTPALYGLMFAGVPSVNSIASCIRTLERPVVYAELGAHMRLGDRFPMLPLNYYSNQSAMMFTPEPPIVVKVGSAEAGYGKLLCESNEVLKDVRSLLALHSDFITVERFVEQREYDIRVQVIGKHIRAFHRRSAVGSWKGNVGSSVLEEVELDEFPHYLDWAEIVRPLLGGLDIYTVDAIHTESGKDLILEINDSASGFAPDREEEDMKVCADLALQRLAEYRVAAASLVHVRSASGKIEAADSHTSKSQTRRAGKQADQSDGNEGSKNPNHDSSSEVDEPEPVVRKNHSEKTKDNRD